MRVIGRSIFAPSARALDPLLSRALFVGLLAVLGSLAAFTRIPSTLAVVYALVCGALVGDRIVRRSGAVVLLVLAAVWLSSLEDGIVWVGHPDRMAGTLHWLSWLTIGLALPHVLTTERRWHLAGSVFVGVVIANSGVALIEPFYSAPDDAWFQVRRYGLTANPGFLGVLAMAGTIIAAARIRGEQRLLWGVITLLCLFTTLSSGTRTVALGLVVALAVLPLPLPRHWRWVYGLFALAAILGAQMALGPIRLDNRAYALEGAIARPLGYGFEDYVRGLDFTPISAPSEDVPDKEQSVPQKVVRSLPSVSAPAVEAFRVTPEVTTAGGVSQMVAFSDFPHNMVLQLWWDLGLLGLFGMGLFFIGMSRLRGMWLALGLAFTVYSLFWIPSPGWFAVLALLMGRMIYMRREGGDHGSETG